MKKIILLLGLLAFHITAPSQTADSLWNKANNAYAEGNFGEASAAYAEIEKTGNISADLYFNMGNAYYKQQLLPEAILYYERALRIHPENKDFMHNLSVARAQTLDKIDEAPEFIVNTWAKDIRRSVGVDVWATFSLLFLATFFLFLSLFFFARHIRFRKISFFLSVFSVIMAVGCFLFASTQKGEMMDNSEAVIFPAVVTVKSAPNRDGKDLFIIHEGTKIIILEELREWQRVQLLDGKQGWIAASSSVRI